MAEWWSNLTGINQAFYIAAAFFSVIFLWQFIASLIGLAGGDTDVEIHADTDVDVNGPDWDSMEAHSMEEAAESIAGFKILSIRAILAFLMLFSWAGAMYLNMGVPMSRVLVYAAAWGLAGWAVVVLLVNFMRRMTETGNQDIRTCVGQRGRVYMNIAAGSEGKVRVAVNGVITMVSARGVDGAAFQAGTAIQVTRALDGGTVEVEALSPKSNGKENET